MLKKNINIPLKNIGITTNSGETLEDKLYRVTNNNEPIDDGSPIIYTERREGINPLYDIRTDRFDLALEATTKIEQSLRAKREEYMKQKTETNGETGNTDETA